jgi:sulfatase maturation enzyme AslB (radical SAM superfamily)
LKYDSDRQVIAKDTLDIIFSPESSFRHLAIVGREPLVDETSAAICASVITKAVDNDISVSLITNGINIPLLPKDVLSGIAFLDISLDGGRIFYPQYRGVSLASIENSLKWLEDNDFDNYNALEILNDRTLPHIDDMMGFATASGFSKIVFSPYIPTDNGAMDEVRFITLKQSLGCLRNSQAFMKAENAFLMLDIYHCLVEGITLEEAREIVRLEGMLDKVYFVPEDPTVLGVIRVSHDGLVLSSFDALHTSRYRQKGTPLTELPNLHLHYQKILSRGLPETYVRAA